MAYVPPHKRRSKDSERATPTPEILVPQFKKNLNLRTSKFNSDRSGKIIYAKDAIARWFSVGFEDDECNQSAVNLEAVSVESIERKKGGKPLVLVKPHSDKERNERRRKPWMSIAENVLPDFISALKIVKAQRESPDLDEVKPTLVARFGKILFHGGSLVSAGSFRKSHITEALQRDLKRSFYTSVPAKYVENIVSKVIPKVKVGFEGEKDVYHVKFSDSILPDATLSCKCHVNEDNKLELYKVELNQVRNVVVDISCLEMDLDLRLMLCTKRILTHLSDGETQRIRALVSSAVVDPEVKGGLRWPLGMATSGDRYRVTGVWHTIATAYQNPSVRIKVRNADRYDFRTGTGEDAKEVVIKLKGILLEFENENVERASDMLKGALELIWDHFLCCEPFLA